MFTITYVASYATNATISSFVFQVNHLVAASFFPKLYIRLLSVQVVETLLNVELKLHLICWVPRIFGKPLLIPLPSSRRFMYVCLYSFVNLILSEAVHVVGPPKWPISNPDPQLLIELNKLQNSTADLKSCCVRLNEKLLDLFVLHAYLEQTSTAIEFGGPDVADNSGLSLLKCQYTSRSDSSHNLLNYARNLGPSKPELFGPVNDPLLVSLMTSDTPSPFISRSSLSTALSLTGLPTRYPLPVGGSVILRRSPLELHQTAEFGELFSLSCQYARVQSLN